jgi:hypothetical protein
MVEYAVLMVAAAAALAFTFAYVRSAIAHHFKSGADGIGHGVTFPP